MIHRIGVLDASSRTERTIPVTGNPLRNTVAFSPGIGRSGNVEPLSDW
jgi:hypothetical protein